MLARPVASGGLVFGSVAAVPRSEVRAALRVFVLPEILVVTMSIRDLLDAVPLFSKHDKFLLAVLRCPLRLVESGEQLAVVADLPARGTLESFLGGHGTL